MKKIIFFSIIAFSLSLQALPHSAIEEPGEREQQDTAISSLKQEVLSSQTVKVVMPKQSELERDLVERLEKARKSGDRETSRTLLLELDAIHGIVTLPPKTSSGSTVESSEGLVANIKSLQMLPGDIRVNPLSQDAINPSMVSTPEGILFVAAEDRATRYLNIYRSYDNGKTWPHITTLTNSNGYKNPSSAYLVDPDDGVAYVYIAYEYNSNSSGTDRSVEVFRFAVADINNYSFLIVEDGITMGGADDHIAPEIISDYEQYPNDPYLHITYSKYGTDYYPVFYSRSIDEGTTWTDPKNITGGAENSSFPGHPDITYKGSKLYVAFNKLGYNGSMWKTQVWVTTSITYGIWSTPVQLTESSYGSIKPRIEAAQDNNNIMVGWLRDFGGGGTDYDILYGYSTDSGANWDDGGSISSTYGSELAFELAHSAGKFHIAYHLNHMLKYENIATSDISNYTKWTNPVQVDDNSGKVSEWYPWPGIAVPPNSNEKACFAWSDYRNSGGSGSYDIYFNRVITTEFLPAVIMYLLD